MQDVYFCVQWEKGKVKRQLKILSPEVCKICSALRMQWLEAQAHILPVEPEAEKPTPLRQPLTVTIPQSQSAPAKIKPREVANSWTCEKSDSTVHYTVCFNCRETNYNTFLGCLKIHPQIALAIAYWRQTLGNKK